MVNFRWNINFWRVFIVNNCSRASHKIADHKCFVIRCEYCLYNVIGFARNYFTSAQCLCAETGKDKICKHFKQLAHSINFLVMKICINSRDVKEEFMEEMRFMKINHYLEKVLTGSPIFSFSKEKNRLLISINLLDWGHFFINK